MINIKADWGLFVSSDRCSGCILMKPVIKKLIDEGYRIRWIDFHTEKGVVQQYKVTTIPTLILNTNQGQEIKRWSGVVTAKEIKRFMNHA